MLYWLIKFLSSDCYRRHKAEQHQKLCKAKKILLRRVK